MYSILQRIELSRRVLNVRGKSVCAFTRQQFEIHREDADARARVRAERHVEVSGKGSALNVTDSKRSLGLKWLRLATSAAWDWRPETATLRADYE